MYKRLSRHLKELFLDEVNWFYTNRHPRSTRSWRRWMIWWTTQTLSEQCMHSLSCELLMITAKFSLGIVLKWRKLPHDMIDIKTHYNICICYRISLKKLLFFSVVLISPIALPCHAHPTPTFKLLWHEMSSNYIYISMFLNI